MTTFGDMLSQADRQRRAGRLNELRELNRLMRGPGCPAEAPEPVPLHRRRGRCYL